MKRIHVTYRSAQAGTRNGIIRVMYWIYYKLRVRLFIMQNGDYQCIPEWDLIIAHPPCTYLSRAAGRWLYNPNRLKKTKEAFEFVLKIWNAPVAMIAIENPPGWLCTNWKRPTQKIHPWYFGDPEMKETCLWLKGLPRLNGLHHVAINRHIHHPKPMSSRIGTDGKVKNKYFVSRMTNAKDRAKTFPGIASAMATQWGAIQESVLTKVEEKNG